MDEWLMMNEEELWRTFFEEDASEEDSLMVHFMKLFCKEIKWRKKKKSIDQEEEMGYYYNVSVYRVLPYPPNSKDVQDFFVQRN
jgi:hypothetical protein